MSEPLVIIGNGMATMRLVEELSQRALGRYAIAVIGEEPRLAYNRVLLSSVLAGEVSRADVELKSAQWWRAHGVTLDVWPARGVNRYRHAPRQARQWRDAAVQETGAGDRLQADPPQRARHGYGRA